MAGCFIATCTSIVQERAAHAFSQKSPVSAGSHEFLTVFAARATGLAEYIDVDISKGLVTDGDDLERMLTRRKSPEDRVYSAMVGQRWVDAMGFTKVTEGTMNSTWCLEAVAQRPDSVQYDHFLRKRCDEGDAGRRRAIEGSIAAFKRYFVEAALAPEDSLAIHHGGFTRQSVTVNRAYFLFGRAVHLFQDSFSEEHALRTIDGKTIRDIKSYACTKNSPQHAHDSPTYANKDSGDNAFEHYPTPTPGESALERTAKLEKLKSNPRWFLKDSGHSRHAWAAMLDLWKAFATARKSSTGEAARRAAEKEADGVINEWMRFIRDAKTVDMTREDREWQERACDGYAPNQIEWLRKTCLTITGTGGYDDDHVPPFRHMGSWDKYAEMTELDWVRKYRPIGRTDLCPAAPKNGSFSAGSAPSVGSSPILETAQGYVSSKRGYICKDASPCGKESERIARLEHCSGLTIVGDVVKDREGTKLPNGAVILWIRVEVGGKRGWVPLSDIHGGRKPKECHD